MSSLSPGQTTAALVGSISALALALLLEGPLFLLPAVATPILALGAVEGVRKHGVSSIVNESIDFSTGLVLDSDAPGRILKNFLIPEFQPGEQADTRDTPGFWTAQGALNSKIIVGARGSGKSTLAQYFAGQIATNGSRIRISDRHYPSTNWLPGCPKEDFERAFLVGSAEDTLAELKGLSRELKCRIEGGDRDGQPLHLLIDEWGGCYSQWSEVERSSAIEALTRISEEGRKFGVNYTVVLHNLTREKTGIDQALLSATDLYLCGDALSNSTWKFPRSLVVDRDSLNSQRQVLLKDRSLANQRILIFKDTDGESKLVIAPDLRVPEEFQPVYESDLKKDLEARIEAAYEPGMSIRQLCAALGIKTRKLSNLDYVKVSDYIAGKSAPPT